MVFAAALLVAMMTPSPLLLKGVEGQRAIVSLGKRIQQLRFGSGSSAEDGATTTTNGGNRGRGGRFGMRRKRRGRPDEEGENNSAENDDAPTCFNVLGWFLALSTTGACLLLAATLDTSAEKNRDGAGLRKKYRLLPNGSPRRRGRKAGEFRPGLVAVGLGAARMGIPKVILKVPIRTNTFPLPPFPFLRQATKMKRRRNLL